MVSSQDYDYLYKLLLVGEAGVGKSSLLLRYADDTFSETYLSTIGVDFKIKTITVGDKVVKLQIWDTAGQERFKTITSSYYKGAHGFLIIYDISDRESFENLQKWLEEIKTHASSEASMVIVGNKSDLHGARQVSYDEGQQFASSLGFSFIEASAKDSSSLEEAFTTLVQDITTKRNN